MTDLTFTPDDKLAALDWAIEDLRDWRSEPGSRENEIYRIMKAIRKDLAAQQPGEPGRALLELQRRIADAAPTKGQGSLGFAPEALIGLGQTVIGFWPVVRQALTRFGAEVEANKENDDGRRTEDRSAARR